MQATGILLPHNFGVKDGHYQPTFASCTWFSTLQLDSAQGTMPQPKARSLSLQLNDSRNPVDSQSQKME